MATCLTSLRPVLARIGTPPLPHDRVHLSGPGGLHVVDAAGARLGTMVTLLQNMAWCGEDGRTLHLCARDHLHRMGVAVPGAPFASRHRPGGTPQ